MSLEEWISKRLCSVMWASMKRVKLDLCATMLNIYVALRAAQRGHPLVLRNLSDTHRYRVRQSPGGVGVDLSGGAVFNGYLIGGVERP